MTHGLVVWIQTWAEIKDDFGLNWFIYLSMPFVAAFIGWGTKIIAVEMLYRPVEYKGIGPLGWQGIVPRRAGKVASKTIDLLTENLLKPEELLDDVDTREAIEELREPLTQAVDEIAREVAEDVAPGLWDSMPDAARRAVLRRVESQAPQIADRMLAEMRADLNRYIDVHFLAVTTLVRNKDKLNKLMRGMSGDAMGFMRRSGIYFGLGIGLLQMVAWAAFRNPWIMPAFGFAVGFISDWVALNMLFRPQYPKRYLGLVRFQGLLHAKREKITREYARILAEDLFSPENLFDAVLHGPSSDKLFALVAKEVDAAIDAQAGVASPLVALAVGTQRYRDLKDKVARLTLDRLPDHLAQATDYAKRAIDLEVVIIDKMSQLTNEQYESILRPVFKDDEPLVIAVGAILGGAVGELQVLMIEILARHPSGHG